MDVKLNAFVRKHVGIYLLFNPRHSGSIVLRDADDFLMPLLQGKTIRESASVLSDKYGIESNDILYDLINFYTELSRRQLVVLKDNGMKWEYEGYSVYSSSEIENEVDTDDFPVMDFYSKSNLLGETHFDLTDTCTERCVHCYVPQGQCDYLPYSLVKKVLREFREQQGLTVQLSGGECMMHPDFAKICRLCRKLDLNFIVLSNLTRCDEKMIEILKETDPQFVNVSLYSMKAEEHDAITRIRGSWKKTMTAIDACQAAGIHIRLATPLLKTNQHAYPALRKFAAERRVHIIPDCDILPKCNGDCSNLNYACSPEEVEAVLSEDPSFWDRGYGKVSANNPEDKVCDIGKLLCVNSKGDYYPCSGMHGYVLGNARDNTLTEVWKGEKMEYLRGLKNKDFPKCVHCEHRAFCKVCPAFNFNATRNLFTPIPAKCKLAEVKHRVFGGN